MPSSRHVNYSTFTLRNLDEILEIFSQLTRQLGNLHGCTVESSNFENYFRILEQLSEVKIGVVLVDLIRFDSYRAGHSTGQQLY